MSTIYTNSYWSKTLTYGLERSAKLSSSAGKTVRKIKAVFYNLVPGSIIKDVKRSNTYHKTYPFCATQHLMGTENTRSMTFCKSTAVWMNRLAHIAYFPNWYCIYWVFHRSSFWNIACIAYFTNWLRIILVICVHCVPYIALRFIFYNKPNGMYSNFLHLRSKPWRSKPWKGSQTTTSFYYYYFLFKVLCIH